MHGWVEIPPEMVAMPNRMDNFEVPFESDHGQVGCQGISRDIEESIADEQDADDTSPLPDDRTLWVVVCQGDLHQVRDGHEDTGEEIEEDLGDEQDVLGLLPQVLIQEGEQDDAVGQTSGEPDEDHAIQGQEGWFLGGLEQVGTRATGGRQSGEVCMGRVGFVALHEMGGFVRTVSDIKFESGPETWICCHFLHH